MFRTFLSLRYLRARKPHWIGMAGIFVAVAALVMILSIMGGFLQVMRDTLRGNLADLQITPGELRTVVVGDKEFPAERDVDELVDIVEAHPLVEAATPQLGWYGLLMPDYLERAFERPIADQIKLVQIVGIDPETEAAATEFRESLERDYSKKPGGKATCTVGRPKDKERPFALPESARRSRGRSERPPDPILVGEQIAYIWSLYKGQTVTLFSATFNEDGQIAETAATRRFQVVGSFRTADNEMDSSRVYLLRGDAADFLQRDLTSLAEAPARPLYAEALTALQQSDADAALARFIQVLVQDRSYDADGARRACLAIFATLGEGQGLLRDKGWRF